MHLLPGDTSRMCRRRPLLLRRCRRPTAAATAGTGNVLPTRTLPGKPVADLLISRGSWMSPWQSFISLWPANLFKSRQSKAPVLFFCRIIVCRPRINKSNRSHSVTI